MGTGTAIGIAVAVIVLAALLGALPGLLLCKLGKLLREAAHEKSQRTPCGYRAPTPMGAAPSEWKCPST